jgi:hypothetical protein
MKPICLVDGRFEAEIDGERLSIFDLSAAHAGDARFPLHVLDTTGLNCDMDAGQAALEWLRDNGHISSSEFYHGSDELRLRYRNPQ